MDNAHNKHGGVNHGKLTPPTDDHLFFKQQTHELVHAVFYTLLAKDGNFANGYTQGTIEPHFEFSGSEEVYQSFLGACTEFIALHGDELKESIDTLDMSNSKVCNTFHETILLIFQEINWGRIVSAVCASKTMASRAIKEGRVSLVESLEAWLQIIFKDRLQEWIEKQGGWVSVDIE